MLGEMIRSWKYPTRLVIVIRVPIGAFRLFFLTTSASTGAAMASLDSGPRSKCLSSFGVLTLSLSDLSASLLESKASTVLVSSSSSDDSESSVAVLVFESRRVLSTGLGNLSDSTLGRTLLQPLAGLVPRGVFDPLRMFDFSSVGDKASPGSLEEIAWPQLFCLDWA